MERNFTAPIQQYMEIKRNRVAHINKLGTSGENTTTMENLLHKDKKK